MLKINKIKDWDEKICAMFEYAEKLGVFTSDLRRAPVETTEKKLHERIRESEREWRTASFAFLSAIMAILSTIAAWIAVLK